MVSLTVGALGGLGLTLADFLAARTAVAEQKRYDFIEAKAESVIHIFLPGGIAHQESFDPKPYSPIEYPRRDRQHPDQYRGSDQRDAAATGADRPTSSRSFVR